MRQTFPLFPEQGSTVAPQVDGLYFYLIAVSATDASSNASHACVAVVVPHSQSPAARSAAAAAGAAAAQACTANGGTPPAGFVSVGGGPIVGPKQ